MQIAFLVYDHMTALDAIGPYEVLSRLSNADIVFVGAARGPVCCDTQRLTLVADASIDEVSSPEIVLVPGWSGTRQTALLGTGPVQEWLGDIDTRTTWTTSVSTGSLILAAAGLLSGRRAATHWLAVDDLAALGAITTDERVVRDGKYITAAGVSAGIDMALTLTAIVAGEATAHAAQLGIEYAPQPPFDAGSPRTAPAEIVAMMTALKRFILYGAG